MGRHTGLKWAKVQAKLKANPAKLWTLDEMEVAGGEPDVVGFDETTDSFIFFDCSAESPKERSSFCYDNQALESRKANKPENSAVNKAADMGIELLSENVCRIRYIGIWITPRTNIFGLYGQIKDVPYRTTILHVVFPTTKGYHIFTSAGNAHPKISIVFQATSCIRHNHRSRPYLTLSGLLAQTQTTCKCYH